MGLIGQDKLFKLNFKSHRKSLKCFKLEMSLSTMKGLRLFYLVTAYSFKAAGRRCETHGSEINDFITYGRAISISISISV